MARLFTSKKTEEILKDLQSKTNLRPNILSRMAINLSLQQNIQVPKKEYDDNGFEFRKETLMGNYEILFKALISQKAGKQLSEQEFFPEYTKLHIENGITLLKSEYELGGNYEKFILNLMKK